MHKKNSYTFFKAIRKNAEFNKRILLDFLTVVMIVLMYMFVNNNYEFYVFSTSMISLGIIIGFVYTNIIKSKVMNNKNKTLRKVYLISALIVGVLGVSILSIQVKNNISYIFFLLSLQSVFEYCEIENIFNIESAKINNIVIYIGFLLAYAFIIFINDKNIFIFYNYIESFTVISVLVSLCMSLTTLNKILEHRNIFSADEFRKTVYYMCSIILSLLGYVFMKVDFVFAAVILITMKCSTFIKFYNYVIDKIRDEYFNFISSNIKDTVDRKKQVYLELSNRNKILNDTNIMINKAQHNYNILLESIYGAVCLFTDDKLEYINNNMLDRLNRRYEELIGIDIDLFLDEYCNLSIDKMKERRNYPFFMDTGGKSIRCRAFLICPNKYNKLVYIEDLSDESENRKFKREFEEYLEYDQHKKQFFANISHELKTPINVISSALQLNNIFIRENNIQAVDKNRKIIMHNCLRLIRTINNFIDSNKISEGYMTPDMKIYNIVEIVENTALACNKYIEIFNNTLIFDSEEEEIYVKCDKDLITRIILNLLSNSVKYGKKGGNIKVNLNIEDSMLCIRIKNDGPKIEKEIIPYIFDKFTKLNKAFNRIKEGSGLGLFLTKALVELQGGTISLVSESRGNEFIIKFKYIEEAYEEEICYENFEMNSIDEKVNIEFSDIYRV
ncbi:sensor histidine kinase KdpD [uncultured Clostridium sp.]|uniref:sensor histidine kinase n=1 Tax=uncultured Clostridium sp. TaxID=59620 RepID=UPI0025E349D9|nr:HAMP domain-containing sensor histidine kinase [uncultured Clostridium sp.]